MFEMTYYCTTAADPSSLFAGALCQKVANEADRCGYGGCMDKVVGAAVHSASVKVNSKYIDGSKILPVCQKHKEWEYTKLNNENIAWCLD